MFYRKYRKIILPALFLPLFLIVWELYIRLFHVPNYLLPGPAELADSMVKLFVSGDIMKHIRVTMEEILMGTVIGIVIGLILGYIMAKIRFIERLIMPFVSLSRQRRRFPSHRYLSCGWDSASNQRQPLLSWSYHSRS